MKIRQVLKNVYITNLINNNHSVSDIVSNSKLVKYNNVFVCVKGLNNDGHKYINEAIKNGAKTIIYEDLIDTLKEDINYIKVSDSKKIYSMLIAYWYKRYLKNKNIIGVTGTNGKTTVATLIYEFYKFNNINALYIGTNKIIYNNKCITTSNTTPDIKVIYECLKICSKNNIKNIIIETSSIAIKELRLYKIKFNHLIFTNLTHDHLDYHENFTDYLYSKSIVFSKLIDKSKNFAILNKDDLSYKTISNLTDCKIIDYSLDDVCNIKYSLNKMTFNLKYNNFLYPITTNLIGEFNILNILSVIYYLINKGFKLSNITLFLKEFKSIKGRMNIITHNDKNIIIDYAHTPDGVLQVLKTMSNIFKEINVCIGAGGQRDISKRYEIGKILNKFATNIYLTNDNPRFEDELKIINDIKMGITKECIVILDREEAIKEALDNMNKGSVLLILGKGCENYQVIKDKVIEYSDYNIVNKMLES